MKRMSEHGQSLVEYALVVALVALVVVASLAEMGRSAAKPISEVGQTLQGQPLTPEVHFEPKPRPTINPVPPPRSTPVFVPVPIATPVARPTVPPPLGKGGGGFLPPQPPSD